MLANSPAEFDPEAFRESLLRLYSSDHTRVYATVIDGSGEYIAATTHDGRVVVWCMRKHLVCDLIALPAIIALHYCCFDHRYRPRLSSKSERRALRM